MSTKRPAPAFLPIQMLKRREAGFNLFRKQKASRAFWTGLVWN
jgi:hypothetical protein